MRLTAAQLNERRKIITDLVKNQKYSAIDVARKLGTSRQRMGQIFHKLGLVTNRMRKVKFGNPRDKFCSLCGGKKSAYAYICQRCYREKLAAIPKRKYSCPICGKPKASKALRCWQCFIKSFPLVELKCETCGNKFTQSSSMAELLKKIGRSRRFCSRHCFMIWWKSPHKKISKLHKK